MCDIDIHPSIPNKEEKNVKEKKKIPILIVKNNKKKKR